MLRCVYANDEALCLLVMAVRADFLGAQPLTSSPCSTHSLELVVKVTLSGVVGLCASELVAKFKVRTDGGDLSVVSSTGHNSRAECRFYGI